MIDLPIAAASARIAAPNQAHLPELQSVWSASQDHDQLAGRPHDGWWSVANWATAIRLLTRNDAIIGFVALEYTPGAEAAEARLGLLPRDRKPAFARRLVDVAIDLARVVGAPRLRLYAPAAATWATTPAHSLGFRVIRTQHLMVRTVDAGPEAPVLVSGMHIRALRADEDTALLAALNRAWSGTWNFRPITAAALANDLRWHRAGMLGAIVEGADTHIVGTVHALFDPGHQNPDGGPYAWISNLTIDSALRGRGLGRALLLAGVAHLHQQGATSIALGVDGGNTAALQLYRSVGFTSISIVNIWELPLDRRA